MLLYGLKASQQSADEADAHVLAYNTPRAGANAILFDLWNASTNAGREWCVDLNGKMYSGALTAGDLLYAVAGGIAGVKRLDSLVIGTAGQALKVNAGATAPEWGAIGVAGGGTGLATMGAAGALLYSTGATTLTALAAGAANQLLRVNAGATAPEWASTLSGLTLTTPTINGAALSGTLTGTPTWGSAQAITLSTAAQPNVTSLGTLAASLLFVDNTHDIGASGATRPRDLFLSRNALVGGTLGVTGLVTASGGLTVASGQTLTVTGATITGTPTWSSAQAITLSTAAQPNITSVGTLTGLTLSGSILASTGSLGYAFAGATTTGMYLEFGDVKFSRSGQTHLVVGDALVSVPGAKLQCVASSSPFASLQLQHGSAPSAPADGDVWTTTTGMFVRVNGTTKQVQFV